MKKNLTELVMILDRSGSMSGLESDTIGGYNSMLKKQRELREGCFPELSSRCTDSTLKETDSSLILTVKRLQAITAR